jgi:cysteinyl-tRNA synthetase
MFVPEVNARLDALQGAPLNKAEQQAALTAFERMDRVFGFLELADREAAPEAELAAWVEERLAERKAARLARNFARSDAIRAELLERGVVVEDTPQGQRWSILP